MAQRKQTPISGISTASTYDDGATCSLVNLRPKNGALHPVPPRKVEQVLSREYDIIFVHKNNDYENWVGIVNGTDSATIYWDVRNSAPQVIASVDEVIGGVQQIGNTLSLITGGNVSYLLFQSGKYTYLGELPEIPIIHLSSQDEGNMVSRQSALIQGDELPQTDEDLWERLKGIVNVNMLNIANLNGPYLFDACYIRYAFRLSDGSLTRHSPPMLVMPPVPISELKELTAYYDDANTFPHLTNANIKVLGCRIGLSYDFSPLSNAGLWDDIIESVDIFMSAPLGLSNIEKINKNIRLEAVTTETRTFPMVEDPTTETLAAIEESSSFYLIKSIPLGATSSGYEEFPSEDMALSNMGNLIHQEVMSDDQFSHHKIGASVSYAYNSRLHLADLRTSFFKGFSTGYFYWSGKYNGADAPVSINPPITTIIEIEINTGVSVEKTYTSYVGDLSPSVNIGAFVSYPDTRAQRMTIYEAIGGVWERRFTAALKPHKFLNLAYYLNDQFEAIVGADLGDYTPQDTSRAVTLSEPNKLKVSELNNPLIFPVANTYQIGDGEIMALATNAMNVSDRNYGQWPMYIFTSRGIWALNVGSGEVAYSSLSAPVSMETPISKVVTETPYGVVFAARRGLMLVNGQSVDFLSPQIEEAPTSLNIEMNSPCYGVVFLPEGTKFSELLKNLRHMAYDPHENELIVNTGAELNYVLNFPSRSFWQSTEAFDLVVGNAFPNLFVADGGVLKNYAAAQGSLTHIGLTTLPMQFGAPDIKRLERMTLRSRIYGAGFTDAGKRPLYMFHQSMDGVNFKAITGQLLRAGNHMDLDSGLLARAKSSYFMFSLAGSVDDRSDIGYLDSVFDKEYNNTKLR